MTIIRTPYGAWRISTIHKCHLVSRMYFGMTQREAIAAFKQELAQ